MLSGFQKMENAAQNATFLFHLVTIDAQRNAKTDTQTQLLRSQIREQQYLLRACREPRASLLHHKYDSQRESHVCRQCGSSLEGRVARLYADQLAEGLTEFGVEHSVYYGIHKAVHITQPGGDDESCNTRLTGLRQFRADCIHDVAGEEGYPAYQKDPCGINYDKVNQSCRVIKVRVIINDRHCTLEDVT